MSGNDLYQDWVMGLRGQVFKANVVRLAHTPPASVAGVALQHGINPVTVHRWPELPGCMADGSSYQEAVNFDRRFQ